MGEVTTGARCVGTDAALWVVGGLSDNPDFTGLQRYTYATDQWETITPTDLVTKNRQWHSATYITEVNALMIYAGSQDGIDGPSTQTFTITLSDNYPVQSSDGTIAPPARQPILLNWSAADVVMLGGDAANTKVYYFNPGGGWRDYGATLAAPLSAHVQGTLVEGEDGSKNLLTFDFTQSPNLVQRIVLRDASGTPVTNSAPVKRRDLTLDDWPDYNSTLAPTATRDSYAMAVDGAGMVVIAGGNAEEPLAMFDVTKNSWMNTTSFFEREMTIAESSSTTQSTTRRSTTSTRSFATTTAASSTTTFLSETTAATTSNAAVAPVGGSGDAIDELDSNTILGITLGSIAAFILVLGLVLLCFRRRKRLRLHSEAGHARRASGLPSDEKNPHAFSSDALPPRSPTHFRGHNPQMSQESYSSMAILMGRMGPQKQGLSRKASHDSAKSSVSSVHKQFKSTISKPVLQERSTLHVPGERGTTVSPNNPPPRPRNPNAPLPDGTRRSSGWNRYWSGGSALQMLGFGGAKRGTMNSEQSSRYSDSTGQHNPRITQDSATVPPLNFEGRPEMSSVNTGSPIVSQHSNIAAEGMMGTIERPVSKATSGYSSGIPESINDSWHPSDNSDRPWGHDRAPSSAYAPSYNYSNQPRNPSGISRQPQLAMAATSSDMSWLNLGDQSKTKSKS